MRKNVTEKNQYERKQVSAQGRRVEKKEERNKQTYRQRNTHQKQRAAKVAICIMVTASLELQHVPSLKLR